ncbi:Mitochondrial assembly of ribosomal large subunit protein 1 [Melipona quadrifasciata]|uniref:Mitochondrial assembly of ribosomal large subunit protein 1 n=1 Tax=Melipona quadrifasciata TaxID=166423 RepID=A0A0N0BHS8_9HYME|nr:Mitochondrial assembly of ribosomal large subunit protein 1 [Melipona quadrifasciata]
MRSLLINLLRTKKQFYEYLKPCTNSIITYSQLRQIITFSNNSQKWLNDNKNVENKSHNLVGSIGMTHKVFEDQNAEIIFDTNEKQEAINLEDLRIVEKPYDPYEGINTKLPSELSYVDYIVIVTGRSKKHMQALANFVRKVYKLKKNKTDFLPKIEGENSNDWIALDLGNIVLHIFSNNARSLYDLEVLWSVGSDYDDKNKSSTEDDIMEQYNTFLSDLEPIENDDDKEQEMYKKQ